MSALLELIEGAMASWRLANMLVNEDGPGRAFLRLRKLSGVRYGEDVFGNEYVESYNDWTPLTCMLCTTVWTSVLVALLPRGVRRVLVVAYLAYQMDKFHNVDWEQVWQRVATAQ